MKRITFVIFALLLSFGVTASELKEALRLQLENDHRPVSSYKAARLYVFGHLYIQESGSEFFVTDLYCNKEVRGDDIAPMSIPYAGKINVEHVWPRTRFSSEYASIQRKDLFNLIPVDPRANAARGNLPYGEVTSISKVIENCTYAAVNREVFEPADAVKGNIARIMFYFSTRYNMEIDADQEAVLREWHRIDPVDEVELEMNQRIYEIQNVRNPFVDYPVFVETISDF